MDNILLIRLKAIGDVIFTLPAVSALREHFPAAKITFLTSKENATLLRGFPQVSEVIALDRAARCDGVTQIGIVRGQRLVAQLDDVCLRCYLRQNVLRAGSPGLDPGLNLGFEQLEGGGFGHDDSALTVPSWG